MRRALSTKSKHLRTDFMNDILNKTIVLVLNRNWQAINIRLGRQGSEREERQPSAAGSRLEAAPGAAYAKGSAGHGAHSQCAWHRGLEPLRQGISVHCTAIR